MITVLLRTTISQMIFFNQVIKRECPWNTHLPYLALDEDHAVAKYKHTHVSKLYLFVHNFEISSSWIWWARMWECVALKISQIWCWNIRENVTSNQKHTFVKPSPGTTIRSSPPLIRASSLSSSSANKEFLSLCLKFEQNYNIANQISVLLFWQIKS